MGAWHAIDAHCTFRGSQLSEGVGTVISLLSHLWKWSFKRLSRGGVQTQERLTQNVCPFEEFYPCIFNTENGPANIMKHFLDGGYDSKSMHK